jgi:hypothetical protein
MKTKEEYYQHVQENRKIASDPAHLKCSCPKTNCEWHGKCTECVALHRYYEDHVPGCFQQYINEKLKAVVQIGELTATENEKTPGDY